MFVVPFLSPCVNYMEKLVNSLELKLEIQELKILGLTDEEILGFIEFFYENWFCVENTKELN